MQHMLVHGSGNAVTTVTETGAATAGPVGAVADKLRTYSQPFAVGAYDVWLPQRRKTASEVLKATTMITMMMTMI